MIKSKQNILSLIILLIATIGTKAQEPKPDTSNLTLNNANDSLAIAMDTNTIYSQNTIALLDTLSTTADSNFVHFDSVTFSMNGYLNRFSDTVVVEKWKYNTSIHNFDIFAFDSTLKEFHVFNPVYKQSINNTYLGNIGLATKSNIFFDANPETGYLFLRSFSPYMYQATNSVFYNTQKPFTHFCYNSGPKEEQDIEIVHTQNINKYFNAFVKFKNFSSIGHYVDQETKNNSGTIGGSHIRDRFSTHVSFTFSRINVEENGGIIDTYFIKDTSLSSTTEVGTRLNQANNFIQDRQWFVDQKIGFIKGRTSDTSHYGDYLLSAQYSYSRQKSKRIYEDEDQLFVNTVTNDTSYFYENNYSGSSATFDTNSYTNQLHLFRINLEESSANFLSFGAYVGAGKNISNYTYYNKDTLFVNKLDTTTYSTFVEAGIFRLNPSSNLNFYGHYRHYIAGYRQNDFTLSGMISLNLGKGKYLTKLSGEAKSESKTPDYFLTRFRSNHFQWDNSFKKENTTEFKGKIQLANLQTTVGARYALLTNYIYFDSTAHPTQFNSNFSVFDAYIDNTISKYGINLINKVNYQKSGKQGILPLPSWSFYHALYFEYDITFPSTQGKMLIQLGADVNYWTAFYAPSYAPATAQFYNQNQQLVGDYPFLSTFLNLRIKRMRIYIKGEHINYYYMKDRNMANYFKAPLYPTPGLVIRYGISWTFYD